tara:strand:+ start:45 stop:563 length:519 start_codon:yes stop_codon:yes gene_type:complete
MPIRSGGRIGRKYFYRSETGEVTSSSDPNIPVGSNVYDDGLRRDQRAPKIEEDDNRILRIRTDLIGVERPGELMYNIIKALEDTKVDQPISGNYYTYIYRAKTPGLLYDLHPLILMGEPNGQGTGFFGFNYHWGKIRQYTFPEVQDGYYEMSVQEFTTLRGINYQLFIQNRR